MAGSIIRYRARVGNVVFELDENGWVGVQGARAWCQSLAEEKRTVDLYCLMIDGTEVFDSSFVSQCDRNLEDLMSPEPY